MEKRLNLLICIVVSLIFIVTISDMYPKLYKIGEGC